MWTRIKQVLRYLFRRMGPEEKALVQRFLDEQEQVLFWTMGEGDQLHCVSVAREIFKEDLSLEEKTLLVKAALLHDVGKAVGALSLLDRILYTIVDRLVPFYLTDLQAPTRARSFLERRRQALVILHQHAQLGARMVEKNGCAPEVVALVEAHHRNSSEGRDWQLLRLLQRADQRN